MITGREDLLASGRGCATNHANKWLIRFGKKQQSRRRLRLRLGSAGDWWDIGPYLVRVVVGYTRQSQPSTTLREH